MRRGYSATGKHFIDATHLNRIRDTFNDVMMSEQYQTLKLAEQKYAENKTKSETMIAIDQGLIDPTDHEYQIGLNRNRHLLHE